MALPYTAGKGVAHAAVVDDRAMFQAQCSVVPEPQPQSPDPAAARARWLARYDRIRHVHRWVSRCVRRAGEVLAAWPQPCGVVVGHAGWVCVTACTGSPGPRLRRG